jgi:hypothetical protein
LKEAGGRGQEAGGKSTTDLKEAGGRRQKAGGKSTTDLKEAGGRRQKAGGKSTTFRLGGANFGIRTDLKIEAEITPIRQSEYFHA